MNKTLRNQWAQFDRAERRRHFQERIEEDGTEDRDFTRQIREVMNQHNYTARHRAPRMSKKSTLIK